MLFSDNSFYKEWRNNVPDGFGGQNVFNLKLPVKNAWEKSKRKILLVLEHVDTEDLRDPKRRLTTGPSGSWLQSALSLGETYAKHCTLQRAAYAAINFNFFKTYDLDGSRIAAANEAAATRVRAYAQKMGATDVIIFGDIAACAIMQKWITNERDLLLRRGRPRQYEGIWWTNTISPSLAYQGKFVADNAEEDESESKIDHANLLGFIGRCVGNALAQKLAYGFDTKPKVKLINDFKTFVKLYRVLMTSDRVAVDTETTSLGRVVNNVLTIQFAFDGNRSYVVPLDHQDAPWTPKEKIKVERGLRRFFARRFDPLEKRYDQYLLGQNLKFDLTVLRQRLGLYNVRWRVWDMMAGTYCLDENMKALLKCRTSMSGKLSPYSLEWMCAWYGCDFYAVNAFSKEDRATIETRSLGEPGLLEYCGMDVQVCWGIHDQQRAQAARQLVGGRVYGKLYEKFVVTQMNNLVQIESVMEHRGDQLDMPYLLKLKDTNGPLSTLRRDVEKEFKSLGGVRRANRRLAKRAGVPQQTLWGADSWVLSPSRPAHKQELFINVLGLEPLAFGKTGPKIDKAFQEHYKDVPEVAAFTQISQLDKLRSTYVNGFYDKLKSDPDMRTDFRIRPGFGFTGTVTGRSNSYDPNLQNIPARGKFAKYIKRMFVAPRGCLTLKMDYSSHEVRMWGVVSGDEKLCALFVNGRWLRQQYRLTGNPLFKQLMDTKGDIHKVNCEFFFKVNAADVTKEQRNSVKSIVFGAIYGRGPRAIAGQTGQTVEEVKELLELFFARFEKASGWLTMAKRKAVEKGHMYSPIYRVRNMYTQLYGIDNFKAATERRGCNAPIQGFAADIGHTAGYLYQLHLEDVVRKYNLEDKQVLTAGVNTFVHDAIKTDAPYEYFLVCLQVLQWCATIGAMEYYKTHWNVKFHVEVEVEFEVAAHDEQHWKYDWHEGNDGNEDGGGLQYVIRKALEDQKQVYPETDVDAIEKKIWAIRKNTELTKYLNAHYPVLSDWPESTHIDITSNSFKKGLGALLTQTSSQAATDKRKQNAKS